MTAAADDNLATLRRAAFDSTLAVDLTRELTTEIGARPAGSEADARAVAWAVAKLEALGFDAVRTEPVAFPGWTRGPESCEIRAPVMQRCQMLALGGSIATPDTGLEAEVIGFPDLAALEAAAEGSLNGKIAFIAHRMSRARDGSGYGPAVRARGQGASVAARKGASALLIRSIGTSTNRFAHTGIMRYENTPTRIPAAALSNPDADQLERLLASGKVTVRLRISARLGFQASSANVIGELRGSTRPDEIVLLGAHLDSWDVGTGALDDGVGVGIVTAAAALIGKLGLQPERTIRVVLFAAEENGLHGARAYTDAVIANNTLANHVIGAESDSGTGSIYALHTRVADPQHREIQSLVAALAAHGVSQGHNRGGGGPDLTYLREAGMPVVSLAQDSSSYFDYHHTENDTFDKVDADAVRQNVAVYAQFAWLMANGSADHRPTPTP